MKNLSSLLVSCLFLLVSTETFAQRGLDTLSLKSIFHEPYLAGVRPSFNAFSLDNKSIVYTWNDSSYSANEFFSVNLDGSGFKPIAERPQNGTVSPDGKRSIFTERGTLMIGNPDGSAKRVLFSAPTPSFMPVWSQDSKLVAFVNEGDVWMADVATTTVRRVTNKKATDPNFQVRGWATDNSRLILSSVDNSAQKDVFFPEYVGHMVTPGASKRGFTRPKLHLVEVETRNIQTLIEGDIRMVGVPISESGRYVGVDQTDHYQKTREIGVYDLSDASYHVAFKDSTQGWIASGFNDLRFAPGKEVMSFTSEQSGYNHLYTVNADGSGLKQLTSGDWQVTWYQWLDANQIIYVSTEVDPGERHIYIMDVTRGTTRQLTSEPAFRQDFRLSDDNQTIVYGKTYFNTPTDLFSLNLRRPNREVRLTNSIPDRFKAIEWLEPEYVRFIGRDGETKLSMEVIRPPVLEPGKKYPVIVFVHGAGSLQNVYKGWSQNYYREYMFHHWLAMKGYVVIEVDYRHSLNYGRKFREDVTGWMGKYELEDIIDGIDHVAKEGIIDVDRVGLYGGSYGGFMALYALHHAPDRFHVGAALRAVTNWENYFWANPGYTGPRLGHPEKDKENYLRSSPLTHADSLSRPMILFHGLIDDNVGFQDAMQYIDRLIQSGNENFELMVYPSERHSFVKPAAWYDEYRRMAEYFERWLEP